MKCKLLQITRSFLPLLLLIGSVSVFGQPPANDKCSGAIEIFIAPSILDCVPIQGDTRNTTDANLDNIPSCSFNFKRDDVWFKIVAPDPLPPHGWTIEFEFGSEFTDITTVGFALHASCDTGVLNQPLYCSVENLDRKLNVGTCPSGLVPGETYYLRVWSAVGVEPTWQDGWGTFRICAYENEEMLEPVLWGDQPGEGDFAGGINGWTSVGIACGSGDPLDAAQWVWDPVGSALAGAYATGQVNLSPTFCNGAMVFNSDFLDNGGTTLANGAPNTANGICNAPQEAALVSPLIDISAFNVAGVSLEFHQNFRQFNSAYFVGYSLDGGMNWIDIEINGDVETNSDHINEYRRIALPGAEGSANLRVRFRIEGNYYYWVIDDVRIIERECNNVSANAFYAITPNAQWQIDQLNDFGVVIDIENLGACPATGVSVDFEIRNETGFVVVSGTKQYGTIQVDSLAENDLFDQCFEFPSDILPGIYTATYTVRSDSVDFDLSDNTRSFDFMITESVLAKDMPGEPSSGIFSDANNNWRYGNGYHIVKGGPECTLCEIEVGIGNAEDLRPNVIGAQARVIVRLYEYLDNDNDDGVIDLSTEAVFVGFAEHEFTNDDVDGTIYRLPIFDDNFEECVLLKDNTTYFLFAEYTQPSGITGTFMHVLGSTVRNYVANNFMYSPENNPNGGGLESHCHRHFGDLFDLGNTGFLNYSGTNFAPVVRMLLDCDDVSTDPVTPDPSNVAMTIMPNPVKDMIRVDMAFPQAMDRVVLRVTDMNGRTMLEETQSYAAGEVTWTREVSHLANGAYFLSVVTESGVRTERFVVQQ